MSSSGVIFSEEDVENILLDLEADRQFLNNEVHSRCDYDIYCRLMDRLDTMERMFEE